MINISPVHKRLSLNLNGENKRIYYHEHPLVQKENTDYKCECEIRNSVRESSEVNYVSYVCEECKKAFCLKCVDIAEK